MSDSVILQVPSEIPAGGADASADEAPKLQNPHAGRVTIPAKWTGGDWQAYHEASLPVNEKRPDHQWLRQWRWAKERVIEWDIEGISTNPQEIDDSAVPWPLMSFLTKEMHGAMLDYLETAEAVVETLSYPSPFDLTAGEFFAWEKAVREVKGEDVAPLLQTWRTGRVIIRQWANGAMPGADGLDVDLAVIGAVSRIVGDTMSVALDLGNSRGPRGRP